MITIRDILLGVLLPAVMSAALPLLSVFFGQRATRACMSLAAGVGFVVGYGALLRVPPLQPLDAIDWLYYGAIVIAVVATLDSWLIGDQPMRCGVAAGRTIVVMTMSIAFVWLLARPLLVFAWTGWRGPLVIFVISLVMTLLWLSTDRLMRRGAAAATHLALAATAMIASAAIAMSGSLRLAQIGGILFAATAGVGVSGLMLRTTVSAPGAAMVVVMLYVGLIMVSSQQLYAELTHLNAALLLTAPLCGWAGELIPTRRALLRGVTRIGACVFPALLAATLAAVQFIRVNVPSDHPWSGGP